VRVYPMEEGQVTPARPKRVQPSLLRHQTPLDHGRRGALEPPGYIKISPNPVEKNDQQKKGSFRAGGTGG